MKRARDAHHDEQAGVSPAPFNATDVSRIDLAAEGDSARSLRLQDRRASRSASGDHGAADLPADQWDQNIHVDHPASDPMVLGCGGAQIDQAGGPDVIWNDGTLFNVNTPDGGGWASGGGISVVFPVPSYQTGLPKPVFLVTNQPGRAVPDISMSTTNYFERADGQEFADGGTSAVAPLMAALVAPLNQNRGTRVGVLNPPLYANAAAMSHPIGAGAVGTNGIVGTGAGLQCRAWLHRFGDT